MERRGDIEVSRALIVPLVLLVLAAWPVGAGASPHRFAAARPVTAGSRYLALGDSVTFGYMEGNVVPAPNYHDSSTFVGFPEQLGAELHLRVANASCPGETSASLIDPSAPSNGCENGYRRAFPLHVDYKGSQLAYALHYLHLHHDVRLVSLMIGANDGLLCTETTKDHCASASEKQAVQHQVRQNVGHILRAIRERAHYRGQLVLVNYYSLSKVSTAFVRTLNLTADAAAKPFRVAVADGPGMFRRADRHAGGDACMAGLLTQLGKPGDCGVHPSYAGQALLAQAVARAIRIG
jgi:lysophospholipase L1-like esterase